MNLAANDALRSFLASIGKRANLQARTVGILAFFSVVLVGILLLGLADQLLRFTDNWRWLPWFGLGLAGLVAVWHWALRPLAVRGGWIARARLAEQRRPEFGDELSSAVDLAAVEEKLAHADDPDDHQGFGGSHALRQRSIAHAGSTVNGIDAKSLFPWQPHRRWFVIAPLLAALIAAVAWFSPALRVSMARVAAPWLQLGRPGDLQVAFLNPTEGEVVPANEAFELVVEAPGWGRPATLEIEANGDFDSQRVTLQPDLEDPDKLVASLLAPPSGDHRARIRAGKTITPWTTLTVRDRPYVESFGRELLLPEYARQSAEPFRPDGTGGEIRTLQGTGVSLNLETNTKLSEATLTWIGEDDQPVGEPVDAEIRKGQAHLGFDLLPGARRYQVSMTARDGSLVGITDPQPVEGLEDALPTIEITEPKAEVAQIEPGMPLEVDATARDDYGLADIVRTITINGQEKETPGLEEKANGLESPIGDVFAQRTLGIQAGDVIAIRYEARDIAGNLGPANERVFVVANAVGKQQRDRWMKKEAELAKRVQAVAEAARRTHQTMEQDKPKAKDQQKDAEDAQAWEGTKARAEQLREEMDAAREAAREAKAMARNTLERKEAEAIQRELARLDAKMLQEIEKGAKSEEDPRETKQEAHELESHANTLARRVRALAGEDLANAAVEETKQARQAAEAAKNEENPSETARQVAAARADALAESMQELAEQSSDLDQNNRKRAAETAEQLAEKADAVRGNQPEEPAGSEEGEAQPEPTAAEQAAANKKAREELAAEVAKADPWTEQIAEELSKRAMDARRELLDAFNTPELQAMREAAEGARKLDNSNQEQVQEEATDQIDSSSDQLAEMARSAAEAEQGERPSASDAEESADLSQLADALDALADAPSEEKGKNTERAQQLESAAYKMQLAEEAEDLAQMLDELAATPSKEQMNQGEQAAPDQATAQAENQTQQREQEAAAEQAKQMLEKLHQLAGPAQLDHEHAQELRELLDTEGKKALDQEKNNGGEGDREAIEELASDVAAAAEQLEAMADQARQEIADSLPSPAERMEALAREAEDQAAQARELAEQTAAQPGSESQPEGGENPDSPQEQGGQPSPEQQEAMQELAENAAEAQEDLERLRDSLVADANASDLGDAEERQDARASDAAASRLSEELERGQAEELLSEAAENGEQASPVDDLLAAAADQQERADELRKAAWELENNAKGEIPEELAQEWERAELVAAIDEQMNEGQEGSEGSPSPQDSQESQSPSEQGQPQGEQGQPQGQEGQPSSETAQSPEGGQSESPSMTPEQLEDALAEQIANDPLLRAALEELAADLEESALQSLEEVARQEEALAEQAAQAQPGQPAGDLAAQQQQLQQEAQRASEDLARAARHQERLQNEDWAEALAQAEEAISQTAEGAMQEAAEALGAESGESAESGEPQTAEAGESGQPSEQGQPSGSPSDPQAASEALAQAGQEIGQQLAQLEQAQAAQSAQGSPSGSPPSSAPAMPLAQAIDQMEQSQQGQAEGSESAQGSPSEQGQPGQQPGQPGQQPGQPQPGQQLGSPMEAQAAALAAARASSLLGTPAGQQMASAQPQPGPPSSQPGQPGEPSEPSQQPGEPGGSTNDPQGGTESGEAPESELPEGLVALRNDELLNADWDALPARVAEGVKQGRRQAVAPEFRDAINSYYKAIADRAKN